MLGELNSVHLFPLCVKTLLKECIFWELTHLSFCNPCIPLSYAVDLRVIFLLFIFLTVDSIG